MEENKVPSEKEILLKYLDQVLSIFSQKLVGKLLKRHEIINDAETLKKETKELVYENFRDLRDVFEAYGQGLEMTQFIFKQKPSKEN
jgi:hypothetical protein